MYILSLEGTKERYFKISKMRYVESLYSHLYSLNAETKLHTDASSLGLGAILLQRNDEDRQLHPIHYASWKTSKEEEKYSSYKLEVLAIVKALKKFQRLMQNCVTCILAKWKHGKPEGFLHPRDKGGGPMYAYHLDHLGPLPSTKKSYNHILAVVDAYTKFVWLYPAKSTSSAEVIGKLLRQSGVFGNP